MYDHEFEKAEAAFTLYKKLKGESRADFLRDIADEIEALGQKLLDTASEETNLPIARLTGERGRTCNQLRLFADLVAEGTWLEATIDTALPDREPLPRPDMRRMLVPLGPVVVFGASNFPLAFSTAGGDTASALASGCPVVYKEHPAHPKTSKLVYEAIKKAIAKNKLPEGIFQHVSGGNLEGQNLVRHPAAKAVAFTGSYDGGKVIFDLAMQREIPIPVYAEMGSVNPIFILPERLNQDAVALAKQAAASVLLGVGQFCTCPGLIFVPENEMTETFISAMEKELKPYSASMLHEGIAINFYQSMSRILEEDGVKTLVHHEKKMLEGHAGLATTDIRYWLKSKELHEEVFGPFTLIVKYKNKDEIMQAAQALQGQLTCTLWGTVAEFEDQEDVVNILREKCGRLLFAGVPTGVEVSHAMTHGGPFPATTDSKSTSVGTYAIKRFARPVTFQSAPQNLLPEELKNENPLAIWRTIDGKLSQESLN